jgi:hypothetical protein
MNRAMCGSSQNEFMVVPDFRAAGTTFSSGFTGAWFLHQLESRQRHMVWG